MNQKLITIKWIHTLIWAIMASATLYTLYSGLFNRITFWTWMSIALILGEGIVLLRYQWACPLTGMARKYTDATADNFDIFLPNWLARYNKLIFTTLFVAGLLLVLLRKIGPF